VAGIVVVLIIIVIACSNLGRRPTGAPEPVPTSTQPTQEIQNDSPATQAEVTGDYICSFSDKQDLTAADLVNRTARDLTLMRNEIYARHGRSFRRQDLQDYFTSKSWYSSNPGYADTVLTSLEKRNAALISKYQKDHGLSW
jgi:hypothetical protein